MTEIFGSFRKTSIIHKMKTKGDTPIIYKDKKEENRWASSERIIQSLIL